MIFFLALLLVTNVLGLFPSDIQFGFMGGSDVHNNQGNYPSTKNEFDEKNIPPGRSFFTGCKLPNGDVMIGGGVTKLGMLNDIWIYSNEHREFKWMKGYSIPSQPPSLPDPPNYNPSNEMPARYGSVCIALSSDEVFIFGGNYRGDVTGYYNEVFLFHVTNNELKRTNGYDIADHLGNYDIKGMYHPLSTPSGRYGGVIHRRNDDEIVLFHGRDVGAILSDIWLWNIQSQQWQFARGNNRSFEHIQHATYYPKYGEIGILTLDSFLGGRYSMVSWTFDSEMFYFFGGIGYDANRTSTGRMSDVFAYDWLSQMWKYLGGNDLRDVYGTYPPINDIASLNVYDPLYKPGGRYSPNVQIFNENEVLLMGGRGYLREDQPYGYLGDFWVIKHVGNVEEEEIQFRYLGGGTVENYAGTEYPEAGEYSSNFYPASRYAATMWVDDIEKVICFYGGRYRNETLVSNFYITDVTCLDGLIPNDVPDYSAIFWTLFGIFAGIFVLAAIIITLPFVIYGCYRLRNFWKKIFMVTTMKDAGMILEEHAAETKSSTAHLKINKNLFVLKYENIKLIREIGEGGSGSVIYKANWKGKIVAFKVFKVKMFGSQEHFEDFEKEVSILSSLAHPNILQFYGATLKQPRVGIVMEFCSLGTIEEYLLGKRVDITEKLRILIEITDGMDFLHCRNIVHRDLTKRNILLNKNRTIKLIDFGLSKMIFDDSKSGQTKQVGTSAYMAPEITTGFRYDNKVDVFSFGIIMYEVLTNNFEPYGDKSCLNIEMKVATDPEFRPIIKRSEFKPILDPYIELMEKCWQHKSDYRPSFSDCQEKLKKLKISISRSKRGVKKPKKGRQHSTLNYPSKNNNNKNQQQAMYYKKTQINEGEINPRRRGNLKRGRRPPQRPNTTRGRIRKMNIKSGSDRGRRPVRRPPVRRINSNRGMKKPISYINRGSNYGRGRGRGRGSNFGRGRGRGRPPTRPNYGRGRGRGMYGY